MRFAVSFKTNMIPLAYRMMVVSIIKESLKTANTTYYQHLYGFGKNRMKPFASSVYLNSFQVNDDKISLDGFTVIFSSPDQEFILYLYNGLLQNKFFRYQNFNIQRGQIKIVPETMISSNSVIFRTLSPILIEDRQGKPLAPGDPEYSTNVNYFADLVLKGYRGRGLVQELKVIPLKMKKQVIKENNHQFCEHANSERWLYYTGYKGFIQLKGEPEELRLLYQLGLSKRRGQGFGLLEVEREGV